MTPVTCMGGRKLALFGLGRSGIATALALKAGGADVLAFDDNPKSIDKAHAAGLTTSDLREADWSDFAALVLAPGVPLTHPEPHWTVGLAREAGIEIIGDIELFCRERNAVAPGAPFVAITGTNGKSTTTALVTHVLRSAGYDVQMGGNIGMAILSLEPPARDRVHVIEMSSFQIDLTPSLRPSVGVLLNITPDHLDRHGTMENYAAIKERLVAGAEVAIVGIDDGPSRAIAERLAQAGRTVLTLSRDMLPGDGYHFEGTRIFATSGTSTRRVADLKGIGSLRGAHNAQNAAAAVAVAEALGLDPEEIEAGLASFPGLHHRMEEVARLGQALFVNDSKATNADSTEKALLSFDHVFWILGGKPKDGGIEILRPYFDRIEKAYLIGAASEDFARTLDGAVPVERCGTLDVAVAAAAADAARSDVDEPVILLSPACASYDQYPNFEVRGEHFRELVRALPGVEMRS
ncbi:UDP-N-acetylmuramoyl-L-alanine--D-glutamate ligase [Enterovirga aerilata]|uniref:UDP-N-acetylmuramoylalanine--D-glutamate ligase n=1 Tax=Enterovirga aerilata TaxID=2730920 RepID=A0A849I0J3_9HYPH|nr:UDP-N-acetylmuramoyl-L-alanine--D-glutamate ligase [Enterovirga sp. DB1703]NNM70838.1 UDP-N-acetylmuramoyl-L-alanine--D-glutamate ligase [Enterovirga sp. DB1703]